MKKIFLITITAPALFLISCGQPATKKPAPPTDSAQLSPAIAGPEATTSLQQEQGRKDTLPVRKTELVLQDVQVQTLDSTTVIGKPGDWLLTFTGKGFAFTESNPVVMAGSLKYERTYSNEEGSELYVIVPAEEKQRFAAQVRGELRVINPGIGNKGAGIKQQGAELMRKADGGGRVALVYTKYGVTRKRVE
jgi:hypothetical protein